jgi:hypothetical protein
LIKQGGANAKKYFDAIREDGDWLNDWLTHLPDKMRKALVQAGFNLSTSLGNKQSATSLMNYRRIMGGFATGGIASRPGIYKLAEEGFPEIIIPTNPTRRSEASKLLAIAAKAIDQAPGATSASRSASAALQEAPRAAKQPIMIQLVTPDRREFARWLVDDLAELQKLQSSRLSLFERS